SSCKSCLPQYSVSLVTLILGASPTSPSITNRPLRFPHSCATELALIRPRSSMLPATKQACRWLFISPSALVKCVTRGAGHRHSHRSFAAHSLRLLAPPWERQRLAASRTYQNSTTGPSIHSVAPGSSRRRDSAPLRLGLDGR